MTKHITWTGLFVVLAGGCATSQELEERARIHASRARAAAQVGDYRVAQAEQAKAVKYHRKAVKEALDEGTARDVVVPVPPVQPPLETAPRVAPPSASPAPPPSPPSR